MVPGVDEHLTRLLAASERGALCIGGNRIQLCIAETQAEYHEKKSGGQLSKSEVQSDDDAESVAVSELAQEKTREYRERSRQKQNGKTAQEVKETYAQKK